MAANVRRRNISSVGEAEACGLRGRAHRLAIATLATSSLASPLSAADAPQGRALEDCLNALSDAGSPAISCSYRAELTQDERADIRRLTRDILQDATCRVEVKIDRAIVAPVNPEPTLAPVPHNFPTAVAVQIKHGHTRA